MSFLLEHLPIEILKDILSYTPDCPLTLIKCGSKALNNKLLAGAVTTVLLEGQEALDYAASSSSVVSRFAKLGRFELECGETLDSIDKVRANIRLLPSSSLKTLRLAGPTIGDAFLEAPPPSALVADPSLDANGKPLSKRAAKKAAAAAAAAAKNAPPRPPPVLWDVNGLFPNLCSLTLASYNCREWTATNFASLPRSLERLSLNIWVGEKTWDDLSTLPRNLLYLQLGEQAILSTDSYGTLPPSLTHLGHYIRLRDPIAFFRDPQAPKELTHIDQNFTASFDLELLIEAVNKEPNTFWQPSITHLAFRQVYTIDINHLLAIVPKCLVSLTLPYSAEGLISAEVVKSVLPRTLTSLAATAIEWSAISSFKHWPPNLIDLTLHDDPKFLVRCFPRLPRGLTRLCASAQAGAVIEARNIKLEEVLKAGKEMLRIDIARMYPDAALNKDKAYEKGLAQLRLATNAAYYNELKNGRLAGLPLTLTGLKYLNWPKWDETYTIIAPPFARSVVLPRYLILKEFALFFNALPPSVAEVEFGKHRAVDSNSNWISRFEPMGGEGANLTSLSLHELPFGPASLPHLPKTLKRLLIGPQIQGFALPACTVEEIAQMPPNLIFLEIPFRAPQRHITGIITSPTLPWIHLLPRSLTHIVMHGAGCTGDELEKLPRNLSHLALSVVHDTTIEHLRQLPRKLLMLNLDAAPPEDEQPPIHLIQHAADDLTILPPKLYYMASIGETYKLIMQARLDANKPRKPQ